MRQRAPLLRPPVLHERAPWADTWALGRPVCVLERRRRVVLAVGGLLLLGVACWPS